MWDAAPVGDIIRVIALLKKLCRMRVAEGCVCRAIEIARKINRLENMYRERISPWN